MTGAHSPTNPIGPARVTAAAVSTTASTMPMKRVERTGTPSTEAVSSPRAIRSSRRDNSRPATVATTTTGAAYRNAVRPSWLSDPLPQANRLVVFWLNRMSRVAVADCRASATAEPASSTRVVDVPAPDRPEHQHSGGQSADERDTAGGPERDGQPERGHRHDRQVRPGGHREGVRGGQRVAGQRLQQRTGDPQCEPDGDAGGQPRNPGTDQDLPGGFGRWQSESPVASAQSSPRHRHRRCPASGASRRPAAAIRPTAAAHRPRRERPRYRSA